MRVTAEHEIEPLEGSTRRVVRQNHSTHDGGGVDDPFTVADANSGIATGDELLTVHDAAHFLNVSVSWVYEHTRDHVEDRLPFLKLGKYLRFDGADLRAYIDAKRAASRRQPRSR